ncbi:hypothetical protein [uncultured Thomasclavelia sp.]|uniref:hypothetical protein n=1 Tax=uncultured Thomasclavelia sp. TaxID=3025759 RepID=UPI0025F64709|nr:hypothetical protein [uncultured Thomasclavelia sp.]
MKQDLRITKTKTNIENKFIELLKNNSFDDITIKLLISECKINRSTFYRNYEDKYDLLYKIIEKQLGQFEKIINPHFIINNSHKSIDFKPYFLPLLDYFEKNKNELLILNHNKLPINIFHEMFIIYSNYLIHEIVSYYHITNNQKIKLITYYCQIITSNILTAIKWWHLESPETSKKEILSMITITIVNGIYPTLQTLY